MLFQINVPEIKPESKTIKKFSICEICQMQKDDSKGAKNIGTPGPVSIKNFDIEMNSVKRGPQSIHESYHNINVHTKKSSLYGPFPSYQFGRHSNFLDPT
jgi:hypothetical protein